jgi:hypothetical protein
MILKLNGRPVVENLWNHPQSLVERLRALLAEGAVARPDRHRKGFYDVRDGTRVFFIHISPVSGKVMLLATWVDQSAAMPPPADYQAIGGRLAASARLG